MNCFFFLNLENLGGSSLLCGKIQLLFFTLNHSQWGSLIPKVYLWTLYIARVTQTTHTLIDERIVGILYRTYNSTAIILHWIIIESIFLFCWCIWQAFLLEFHVKRSLLISFVMIEAKFQRFYRTLSYHPSSNLSMEYVEKNIGFFFDKEKTVVSPHSETRLVCFINLVGF